MVEEVIAQIQGTAFSNRARSCVKIQFQSDNQTTARVSFQVQIILEDRL